MTEQWRPNPNLVRLGVRRRIWTIPDVSTPVRAVVGPCPWPLGTIIRYRTSGNMYRYTGNENEPWDLIRRG